MGKRKKRQEKKVREMRSGSKRRKLTMKSSALISTDLESAMFPY